MNFFSELAYRNECFVFVVKENDDLPYRMHTNFFRVS